MPGTRRHAGLMVVVGVGILLGSFAGPGESRADRISLRGGGQVRGKLIRDPSRPDVVLFLGETGKTPMVFQKGQVVQVVPEKGPLDEYVVLRERERATAEAEFELGSWCEGHGLADLAEIHYDAAVKRDRDFGPAHQKLGHVLRDGRWLDADELKEAQGLVKYQGRWILAEEKERKEALRASAAEGASWARRIGQLRESYLAGPEDRSREALRRLLAIDEPAAVAPVLQVLGEDPRPTVRSLAARVLGAIPGAPASSGLVGRLLAEVDEEARRATLAEVARRDPAEVVPGLLRALKSPRPEVINRAAWGLAGLNAVTTVPRLVPALISFEQRMVMGGGAPAPTGNLGVSFNAVPPSPGIDGYGGGSFVVPTGPVVGPGVAAFGATTVPYGALNNTSIGLGTGGGSRAPTPRMVTIEHRNAEVLAALIKMTGRDFGYDIPTWKRWVATSFRIDAGPTRRVPQP